MPTKKKEPMRPGIAKAEKVREPVQHSEEYDVAIADYGSALELLRKGDYTAARELFTKIQDRTLDEPELVERARTHARICEHKLAPREDDPANAEDCYYRAVLLSNDGQWDKAIALLDRALREEPTSVRYLYSRASAWAMKGATDRAVADLHQAIAVDPKVRFQAINDPDFERVREEPAFIDIIEPTPTGS